MTNITNEIQRILVIGATGKTGKIVYQRLCEVLPKSKIKAASRQSEVYFDWLDDTTWPPALVGVSHVYLTYFPDLAAPNSTKHIQAFCLLAKTLNIKHITLLSGRGEPVAQACENILINAGLAWTVIRASWFNQNFTEGLFKSFIDNGEINLPVNEVKEPFIDIHDIAEISVQSFIDPRHRNKLYEVTGPELLTFRDIAKKYSRILEKPITFNSVTTEEFASAMKKANAPKDVIDLLTFLFTEVLDGRNEHLSNGVEQALGRKPTSFNAFIYAHIKEF